MRKFEACTVFTQDNDTQNAFHVSTTRPHTKTDAVMCIRALIEMMPCAGACAACSPPDGRRGGSTDLHSCEESGYRQPVSCLSAATDDEPLHEVTPSCRSSLAVAVQPGKLSTVTA